jgi:hypothetical protein
MNTNWMKSCISNLNLELRISFGAMVLNKLWCYGVEHHFKQYFSYIVAVSFIDRGNQGRIQNLWLRGAWVGERFGDRIRSPAGPGQSPWRGPRGGQAPRKLCGFKELQTFIWTTFLNQPHHFYQTKKTWLSLNFVG